MNNGNNIKILTDTREQIRLQFSHPYIEEIKVEKLLCGDYGCEFKDGHRPPFYFERKGSLSDLYGTLGKGYPRFRKELIRARENKIKLILIIEGSLTKVLGGYERSMIDGFSIIKKIFTLWIRYGLYPVFCKNEEEMTRFITEFYLAYGREWIESQKCQTSGSLKAQTS